MESAVVGSAVVGWAVIKKAMFGGVNVSRSVVEMTVET